MSEAELIIPILNKTIINKPVTPDKLHEQGIQIKRIKHWGAHIYYTQSILNLMVY